TCRKRNAWKPNGGGVGCPAPPPFLTQRKTSMKARIDLRQLPPALAVLGVVAAFTGCSPDDHTPMDTTSAADLSVGVEVSSANAKAGDQIALAVKAQAANGIALGVVQGKLVYDANRLTFVGQTVEGSKVTLLNDSKAGRGEIRLI